LLARTRAETELMAAIAIIATRSRASENRTRDIDAQGGHAQGGDQANTAKQCYDVKGPNLRSCLFRRAFQNGCYDRIHGCSPRFHAINLTADSFQRDVVQAMKDFFGTRAGGVGRGLRGWRSAQPQR
jgi:hypothetical protein